VLAVAVLVAPEHELLEQEEREQPREHGQHRALGAARFDRVRQQLEEHGAEQRADGEGDQARDPRRVQRERSRGGGGRQHAAGERGDDNHR